MADAPVCHISVDQVIQQPGQRLIPSIGKATDLKSALQVINQMSLIINMLTGQQAQSSGGVSTGGGTKSSTKPKQPQQDGRWNEVRSSRVIEKVRIEQKDNPENWVEFERINRLEFIDSVTGEKWQWRRK